MKASIIIPVYNAQDTIRKAIDSALNQKFPKKDFEIIVVNDGSTDNTLKILKTYDSKKIKIITQENQGAIKAANKGFKDARGKYVIKLDADDFFKPNILEEMVTILDQKPDIDFVYSDYYERNTQKQVKIISTKDNVFNNGAVGMMFRKDKLAREGFYNQNIKFAEYDLLLKTQNKWKGYHVAKTLFQCNRSEKSITGNKQWVKEALAELEKIHPKKIEEIKKIRKY